jgi:hypothetical protein
VKLGHVDCDAEKVHSDFSFIVFLGLFAITFLGGQTCVLFLQCLFSNKIFRPFNLKKCTEMWN